MKDADLKTVEDRIAWFCEHFQVTRPELEYDPEEPDAILLTDRLIEWFRLEGVSIDWLVYGGVAGMAATFREKYRTDAQTYEAMKLIGKMSEEEQKIMLEALEDYHGGALSFEDAMEASRKKIEALRAA